MENGIWKKGSRSGGTGGNNCAEVLVTENNVVLMRNSNDLWKTTTQFTPDEWTAFIESVKLGEFDL